MPKKELKEFLIPKTDSRLGDVVFGVLRSLEWRGGEVWYMHCFLMAPHGYDYTLVVGKKIDEPCETKSKAQYVLVELLSAVEKEAIEPYIRSKFKGRDVQFFA